MPRLIASTQHLHSLPVAMRPFLGMPLLTVRGAVVVALGLLIGLLPEVVSACSCAGPAPPREALEQRDAVFSGTVLQTDTTEEQWHNVRVTIEVGRVWKGTLGRRTIVATAADGSACGFHFEPGQKYLIYADESEDRLTTGLCHRTALLENAQADLWAFDHGGGLCGTPVDAVSAQVFVFLMIGLAVGRWPVYL